MSKPRSGYQQSDVGVIPEDWRAAKIADVGRLQTGPFGTVLKASEYSDDHGVPLISVGEIKLGKIVLRPDTPVVDTQVVRRLPRYLIREGDILFGRKGGVDRSAPVSRQQDGWFLGSDGIRLRPSSGYASQFLAYQFQTQRIQDWLLENSVGTTMPSMNEAVLSQVGFPIPSTEQEQKVIVEALADADALIEGLEALITKKRDIKQGTMRELLTGDRRLPGFQGRWRKQKLGSAVAIRNEKVQTHNNAFALKCIELEQISSATGRVGRFVDATDRYATKNRFRPGDVLFGRLRPYLRKYWLADVEGVCSTEIWPLVPLGDVVDHGFLFFSVQTEGFIVAASAAYGTHMPRADWKMIADYELVLPPTLDEQRAIAAVLSDMDAEIVALEDKLAKARAVKQGMTQVLLTGEIRLI